MSYILLWNECRITDSEWKMVSENGKKIRRNWTKIQTARKSKHLLISEETTPAASVEPQHPAMTSSISVTLLERAASPTQLRLGPRRNVWIGLQPRPIWAVAFSMQGLETTEWLLLLPWRGFTPRPLLYLRIGRMQLEAVCDGIFQRVVSHAWMTWWLLYVRTSFCKQGEPGGFSLPTSHQGKVALLGDVSSS